MSNRILNKILYSYTLKEFVNNFINWPLFTINPIYRSFQDIQIKKVINRYQEVPFSLRIENTNVCNARCFTCPHSMMRRKQGFMANGLYRKIIDEALEMGVDFINLHNFGEPLLDKDFVWRVKYAKDRGISRVSSNTNGQAMDKKMAEELIKSGLDELFVSLDAASEKVYQKLRAGLNFKKVIENTKYLISLKKIFKTNRPRVIVDFLESSINKNETSDFIRYWQKDADGVCISKIHDWSAKKEGLTNFNYKNYASFSQTPCRLPFTEMLVNWDGSVSLCCQDVEGEVIVGDVNENSLKNIWRGEKLRKIRKKHFLLDTGDLPLCGNCKLRTFWWFF